MRRGGRRSALRRPDCFRARRRQRPPSLSRGAYARCSPFPLLRKDRHAPDFLHRQRQTPDSHRRARHAAPLGAARHARTHRHQVRLRHRAMWRLYRAPGRRRDAHLRAARGGGRRQARHHDRRPFQEPRAPGAARLHRGGRPPVRLLPVGPDHGRRRAAGQEPAPLGRRHRHRDDEHLPLRHLPADPRRHPSRGAGGVTCEPPPTSLGVSSSRPRRSPAWSSASISPRAPGSVPPPWIWKPIDRKSTRLNSSHSQISYAVFCLKKKKKKVLPLHSIIFIFFFFNDPATTEIYTLSLHDALPISSRGAGGVTCEPPPTSLGVSSSRPRRSPAWSSASISPRAPGSVPPPWIWKP